jgi:Flp pilus assembly protein TadG
MRERGTGERGSIVLVITVAVVLVGLMAIGVAEVGRAMVLDQRAQTAADAAALAGAVGGRLAAAELARRNGAELVAFEQSGWEVTVAVIVHSARATARAALEP